jgi:hypothetical protein
MINHVSEGVCLHCEKCGSTHFFGAIVRQYLAFPSSEPGGLLSARDPPAYVLRCLCGHVWPSSSVRTLPDPEKQSLLSSFKSALRLREETEPKRIIAGLSQTYVTRPEFLAAVEDIDDVRAAVQVYEGETVDSHP